MSAKEFKQHVNVLYHLYELSCHSHRIPFDLTQTFIDTLENSYNLTGCKTFKIYEKLLRAFPEIKPSWARITQIIKRNSISLTLPIKFSSKESALEVYINNDEIAIGEEFELGSLSGELSWRHNVGYHYCYEEKTREEQINEFEDYVKESGLEHMLDGEIHLEINIKKPNDPIEEEEIDALIDIISRNLKEQ